MSNPIETLLSRRHFSHDSFYAYEVITRRCAQQLFQLMAEAHRHTGAQAEARRERAYGVYLAWRAAVMENADPLQFRRDDQTMEQIFGRSSPENL